MTIAEVEEDTAALMTAIGRQARRAARDLALAATDDKNAALAAKFSCLG